METKINSNLYTIRKRSDFILASRAKRASSNGINIQARQRKNNEYQTTLHLRKAVHHQKNHPTYLVFFLGESQD